MTAPGDLFTFDPKRLMPLAGQLADSYRKADPFPHIVIDNFLPEPVAEKILSLFPAVDSGVFLDRSRAPQPGKFGTVDGHALTMLDPFLQHMLLSFNSYTMLYFLSALTGIGQLLTDPYFNRGGLHQIVNGGHLDVHADFNFQKEIGLFRRINLLFYLNKDWKDEYGGQLELWDKDMQKCVHSIAPVFNRCVIFNTTQHSLHGHPKPLNLPPGMTRKSIALYYYTKDAAPEDSEVHKTLWKKLPG